ncbi:hypothetical protein BPAE_0247g00010 [Botrytis paeoniae]|uniref:Uncharacterized protein n=1 Tax=Botrytis paeoniae TaxID=278948 RepID=A0A4Z1FE91_9HELO|nr:hypothetical protein BPAE_0247g00010 [Botrytis paeoniae]
MTESRDELTIEARAIMSKKTILSTGALGHQLSATNTKASASVIEEYAFDSTPIGDHAAPYRTEHGLAAKKQNKT